MDSRIGEITRDGISNDENSKTLWFEYASGQWPKIWIVKISNLKMNKLESH